MRRSMLALAALLLSSAVTAHADTLPPRRAGLWSVTTTVDGGARQLPSAEQCIDASTDEAMRKMGEGMSDSACSKKEVNKVGSSYISDSVCEFGGSTVTSRSTMTGDFISSYRGEIDSTFSPPLMGKSASHISMQATYLGPCKPDQKPGDIIMSNGMKMNINDLKNFKPSTTHSRPPSE